MEAFRKHLRLECQHGQKVKRRMIAQAKAIRNKVERQKSIAEAQAYEPQECVQFLEVFGPRSQSQGNPSRERKIKEEVVTAKNEEADAPPSARMKEDDAHGFA